VFFEANKKCTLNLGIIRAEETHIEMLKEIYAAYGYDIPLDSAIDHVVIPESTQEAMQMGVTAEINC